MKNYIKLELLVLFLTSNSKKILKERRRVMFSRLDYVDMMWVYIYV